MAKLWASNRQTFKIAPEGRLLWVPTLTSSILGVTALLAALSTQVQAQGLPNTCYRMIEDSLSALHSTGHPVGRSITYESLIARALETGDEPWNAGAPIRDGTATLDSLHRVNAVLTEGVLALIITDLNRYGSGTAMRAAAQFRRLGGRASVLLPELVGALGSNRVLIGLSALRPGLSDAESQAVVLLACQAGWALEAFHADERFGKYWLRGWMYNDWPGQNDFILGESARLLAGDWRSIVVELLRVSGTVARVPEYESLVR